jgi:hypothetical protein
MSALFVCVAAVLLAPASAFPALDDSTQASLSRFLSAPASTQLVITAGTIAEDPPDNDDDGDEDDVLGSVAVLPVDQAPSTAANRECIADSEVHFVRVLPSRTDSLRAPPQ